MGGLAHATISSSESELLFDTSTTSTNVLHSISSRTSSPSAKLPSAPRRSRSKIHFGHCQLRFGSRSLCFSIGDDFIHVIYIMVWFMCSTSYQHNIFQCNGVQSNLESKC